MEAPGSKGHREQTAVVPTGRRSWPYVVAVPVSAGVLVWALNFVLVQRPVSAALDADSRNAGYVLSAHYSFYVNPSTLVLDLRTISEAAPIDLFRGLFQTAAALSESGRRFERVVLARRGDAVFQIKGDDFDQLGREFKGGQNPVFLLRTLPAKLHRPSGEAAFGQWEGGLLGVVGKQMEDLTAAGRSWAGSQ